MQKEKTVRLFAFLLLSLAVIPHAVTRAQESAPGVIPAQMSDEDVVPAAELEAVVAELENAHAQNYNTLASIIDKVPASARPALEQAMENSKRGYQQSRANRERITAMRQAKANARLAKGNGGQGQAGGQFGARPQQAGQAQPAMRTAQANEFQGGRPTTAGPQNGQQNGQQNGGQAGQARGPSAPQGPVRR
jgi:hypothetical protein